MTSGAAGLVTGDVDILTTASYEAKIEIADKLGNTASFSAVIPTADVAFHLRPGGKGAAFGKYSEKEALEVAWPAEFQKGVTVGGKAHLGADLPRGRDLHLGGGDGSEDALRRDVGADQGPLSARCGRHIRRGKDRR